jgi:hypothetical protein
MMLRTIGFVVVAAVCAAGQDKKDLFTSAPPEVDKALRERVAGFYQAYVDGKFRVAEQFVAEDTKDAHYNQEKTKIRGFEIVKISWDDSFKKAAVVTTVHTNLQMRGQNIPASAPMTTRWKLEDGKWCYFVDPALGRLTPAGTMKPGPGNREGMKVEDMLRDPGVILNQVKMSKDRFLLRSWEKSADTVVLTNGMPGAITIELQLETIKGLTSRIETKELGPGGTSKIELIYDPQDTAAKPTLRASIKIDPFGRTLVLPVIFDVPDDVKKNLPKQ